MTQQTKTIPDLMTEYAVYLRSLDYSEITIKNIKLDMSKFIRASLKYYINKENYIISESQITLARTLMIDASNISIITNTINQVSFLMNVQANISINNIVDAVSELYKHSLGLDETVSKLYEESLRDIV